MDELAHLLSVERRLLELLLFKLVEGRHLLAADEARFLTYAAAEVERAMERVHEAELRRAMLVGDLAADMDVPEEALTLGALARDSVEPFRTIFADHRFAFLALAAEIEDVIDLHMAQVGYEAVLGAITRPSMPSLVDFLR